MASTTRASIRCSTATIAVALAWWASAPSTAGAQTIDVLPGAPAGSAGGPPGHLGGVDLSRNDAVIVQESVGLRTEIDERGFHRFCNVPERHPLRVSVQVGGAEIGLEEFRIQEAAGQVERSVAVGRFPW